MTELIRKVNSRWCETGTIDAADEDIYIYGLDLLIYTILSITVIIVSAAMVGKVSKRYLFSPARRTLILLPLAEHGCGAALS